MDGRPLRDAGDLPADFPARSRVMMTVSCTDCDRLPKVPMAGECGADRDGQFQRMHNGLRVVYGGYHGKWMAEIIRRLRGHHNPQEERVFYDAVKHVRPGATMLELGGHWAYYSLWFRHAVKNSRCFVIEPDPANIYVGKANFALNRTTAEFEQAAVGRQEAIGVAFTCESDGRVRRVPQISVDGFVRRHGIEYLDLLHADIQGAELEMLAGARQSLEQRKIRFLFVSTHHHSISGDALTHQRCRDFLQQFGAHFLAEYTVGESFSGDGLLVASMRPRDSDMGEIPISRNRAGRSLYRETEYDLAEAWEEIARLRSRPTSRARRPHFGLFDRLRARRA